MCSESGGHDGAEDEEHDPDANHPLEDKLECPPAVGRLKAVDAGLADLRRGAPDPSHFELLLHECRCAHRSITLKVLLSGKRADR